MIERHQSQIDASINYVEDYGKSFVEARYVKREDDQTIAYLSSHNGCLMACRFCHLTATKQTEMLDVTVEGYGEQLKHILKGSVPTNRLNINFMARGEPLQNKNVLDRWPEITKRMSEIHFANWGGIAQMRHKKINISTIIPKETVLEGYLAEDVFRISDKGRTIDAEVNIYWSLYSLSEKFRKRWMPKAATPKQGMLFLEGFPEDQIVIHMAFIDGENDSMEDIRDIRNFLGDNFSTMPKINIVRYNPYSKKYGEESKNILDIQEGLGDTCKIVDRVGFDVKASCGMFLEK